MGEKFIKNGAFVIHPDVIMAYKNYNGTRESFLQMFKLRSEALEQGLIYWQSDHDDEMRQTAQERNKQIGRRRQ